MLDSWTPFKVDQYMEAHRCLYNAIEWVREKAYPWIIKDLETLKVPAAQKQTPSSSQSASTESGSEEGFYEPGSDG